MRTPAASKRAQDPSPAGRDPAPIPQPAPSKIPSLPPGSGPRRPLPPRLRCAAEAAGRPLSAPVPTRPEQRRPRASTEPGRSTGSGAAPTVLPRGGSRVHCLRGGCGGGGRRGAAGAAGAEGQSAAGLGLGLGLGLWRHRPAGWAARGGLCALTLRPVEAPREESAVTRAARTTPPARPVRGGGRGRGLGGGRRAGRGAQIRGARGAEPGSGRRAGCRAGCKRGADRGAQWGQQAFPAEMRPRRSPFFALHAPLRGPRRWYCEGGGRRTASPSRGWAFAEQVAPHRRLGCLPGFTPPPRCKGVQVGKTAQVASPGGLRDGSSPTRHKAPLSSHGGRQRPWWGEGCCPLLSWTWDQEQQWGLAHGLPSPH